MTLKLCLDVKIHCVQFCGSATKFYLQCAVCLVVITIPVKFQDYLKFTKWNVKTSLKDWWVDRDLPVVCQIQLDVTSPNRMMRNVHWNKPKVKEKRNFKEAACTFLNTNEMGLHTGKFTVVSSLGTIFFKTNQDFFSPFTVLNTLKFPSLQAFVFDQFLNANSIRSDRGALLLIVEFILCCKYILK